MRILAMVWVLLASVAVQAGTLSFDDINYDGLAKKLSTTGANYGGFTWDSLWYVGSSAMSGYGQGASSGDQFLFNFGGVRDLSVSRADPFDFLGAFFNSPSNGVGSVSMEILAYDVHNNLIGTTGDVVIGNGPTWIEANFEAASRLVFRQSTATSWFTMDDFTFRDVQVAVTEAGSLVLFALGLFGLLVIRRRYRAA